jgi:hypothetical protein
VYYEFSVQKLVKQMPPHQVEFECEANRAWLGVEFLLLRSWTQEQNCCCPLLKPKFHQTNAPHQVELERETKQTRLGENTTINKLAQYFRAAV